MQDVDPFIGSEFSTPKGGILTVISHSHTIRSRKFYVVECSLCAQDKELWPTGTIVTSRYDIARFCVCACSRVGKWKAFQMDIRAKRKAESLGYKFHGWAEEYHGNTTKCILECQSHGRWTSCGFNDMLQNKGCPDCGMISKANKRRIPESVRLSQINEIGKIKGFVFIGFEGRYTGVHTRARLSCFLHGEFSISLHSLITNSAGCSECGVYGYSRFKKGYLYALKSLCGAYIKVGISNVPKFRIKTLSQVTPFKFKRVRLVSGSGQKMYDLETTIHNMFESAGLSGFQGHTEWLKSDPEILSFIDASISA